MGEKDKEGKITTNVYLDQYLLSQIEEEAEKERRSRSGQIEYILQKYYDEKKNKEV